METIFMNMENSKTNEPYKCVLNLSQRLDIRNWDKNVTLQNWAIHYRCKNIRKHYKNNQLKKIVRTWNDEFELPNGLFCFRYLDISNISLKNMKHQQQFFLFMFGSIKLIID